MTDPTEAKIRAAAVARSFNPPEWRFPMAEKLMLVNVRYLDRAGNTARIYNEKGAEWILPATLFSEPPTPSTFQDAQINHMVNRFLSWTLPVNFAPDAGITYAGKNHPNHPDPSGTNLFDAVQAKEMVRHMLGGLSAQIEPPTPITPEERAVVDAAIAWREMSKAGESASEFRARLDLLDALNRLRASRTPPDPKAELLAAERELEEFNQGETTCGVNIASLRRLRMAVRAAIRAMEDGDD